MIRLLLLALTTFTSVSMAQSTDGSAPAAFQRLTLRDVGGLLGGWTLFVRADGAVACQSIGRGGPPDFPMLEKRYQTTIPAASVRALDDVLRAHSFDSLSIAPRPGQPEGVLRSISVTRADGRTAKVSQWAGQQDPDFNAVFLFCAGLFKRCSSEEPQHAGPYDSAWAPQGF